MFPLKAFGVAVLALGVVATASPLAPAGSVSAAGLVGIYALSRESALVEHSVLPFPVLLGSLALCALAAAIEDRAAVVSEHDPALAPLTLAPTVTVAAPAYVVAGPMAVVAVTASAVGADAFVRERDRFRDVGAGLGAAFGAVARAAVPLTLTGAVLLLFVVFA